MGTDPDGDEFASELTRADITAATVFQATLPVPGQVIPDDAEFEEAIKMGEERFAKIGCASCHIPALPLDNKGWIYTEPSPYNPVHNLRPGDAPTLSVDLSSDELPAPRLKPKKGIVWVPAYTDFKLHDITSPLDMNRKHGSDAFFAGNGKFLTRKPWGIANQYSYGHHAMYTTMREAVLAHSGEALQGRVVFQAMSPHEQGLHNRTSEITSDVATKRERHDRERRRQEKKVELVGRSRKIPLYNKRTMESAFCPFYPFCPFVESITYVFSTPCPRPIPSLATIIYSFKISNLQAAFSFCRFIPLSPWILVFYLLICGISKSQPQRFPRNVELVRGHYSVSSLFAMSLVLEH